MADICPVHLLPCLLVFFAVSGFSLLWLGSENMCSLMECYPLPSDEGVACCVLSGDVLFLASLSLKSTLWVCLGAYKTCEGVHWNPVLRSLQLHHQQWLWGCVGRITGNYLGLFEHDIQNAFGVVIQLFQVRRVVPCGSWNLDIVQAPTAAFCDVGYLTMHLFIV